MRRAGLALLLLLTAACTITYIKFPAEEFLTTYWEERLTLQDETYAARRRCSVVKPVPLAPGTGVPVPTLPPDKLDALREKCDRLALRMTGLHERDRKVIRATLSGATIDRETLENFRAFLGPILGLAKDILL